MGENNNVVKSDKWCLEIVNNEDSDSEASATEPSFLNIGKTTIGRNVNADLITDSEFASRNHCFIELNDSDELFLTDSVSMYWLLGTCLRRNVCMCWIESIRSFDIICFLRMELLLFFSLGCHMLFYLYLFIYLRFSFCCSRATERMLMRIMWKNNGRYSRWMIWLASDALSTHWDLERWKSAIKFSTTNATFTNW